MVATVHVRHVALFGEFDAVFVGKFVEAPEQGSDALRLSQMKAVAAAFLADVFDIQIGISAESLNHLIKQSFRLPRIFLVNGNRLRGSSRRGIPLSEAKRGEENDNNEEKILHASTH